MSCARARIACLNLARARERGSLGEKTKLRSCSGAKGRTNEATPACTERKGREGGREGGRRGCFGCSFVRLHCIGSEQGKPVLRRGKERGGPCAIVLGVDEENVTKFIGEDVI